MPNPSKISVKVRTVEGALHTVGKIFSRVGAKDPQLTSNSKHEF
jgi:hypothetical protein